MSKQLKLRRGTTAQHSTFTGASGEVTVDTTKKTLVVHDGTTAGGVPVSSPAVAETLTNKTLTNPTINGFTGSTAVVNLGSGQFYKDASGNVGVGTSSPGSYGNLAVIGSGNGFIAVGQGTSYTQLQSNGQDFYLNLKGTGSTVFRRGSGDAESMRIDSSGNMSVGRTSGGGRVNIQANTNNFMNEFFNQSGSSVGSIQTNGTTTSYGTTSDYRLKDNVQPMQGALETVAQLKPCTYTWKADGSDGQGFIAHELQAAVPDCVTGKKDATRIEQYEISPAVPTTFDEEGNELTPAVEAVMGEREVPVYQGIDTSFLVATLTAAIQEQQAMIEQLKADVDALKGGV